MAKCQAGCTCKRHVKRVWTDATRAKLSASKMGHPVSAEARAKIGAASAGRKQPPEAIEKRRAAMTQHGHGGRGLMRSPEYRTWDGINQRCHNPNNSRFADYGGRGITVCTEWRASFPRFLADVGEKPEPKEQYSIDRIDNNRGYEPGNVRWATRSEQQRNRPRFNPNKRGR